MNTIEKTLLDKLEQRKIDGNYRSLKPESGKVDFCSNDYLGLSSNKDLSELIEKNSKAIKIKNGSGGSRLLSGNSQFAVELETYLSSIFNSEKSLFFNSGYTANLAILSAIPQKGDTIFYDQLIHASLREGGRLSFAQQYSFKHNDLNDLEKKLKRTQGNKFVVAESVYSMDGDFGELEGLLHLCEKYDAYLIWDEAHSTGVWGSNGNGIACSKTLQKNIFARIYTFGKAMGVHGAVISGSEILIDYLINYARPFIYTTAPPLHNLISVKSSFEFLNNNIFLQNKIYEKILFFKFIITNFFVEIKNKLIPSDSPIQVITIGGNQKTTYVAEKLQEEGFDVRPVLSPTVNPGSERLRICLHAFNTDDEIKEMLSALNKLI